MTQKISSNKSSQEYIRLLLSEFEAHQNTDIAAGQANYMKNQFDFFGIKTIERRNIQKPFLDKNHLPLKTELAPIVRILWSQPQRECQYFAQELAYKYIRTIEENDIALYEFMILHKSWWDTVDFIATRLVGNYFMKFQRKRPLMVNEWLASGNIWLQRSALLFQLKYKKGSDTQLIESTIKALSGSKEFFINKAIGWILREYSKTDPDWVRDFTERVPLSGLSKREGTKYV